LDGHTIIAPDYVTECVNALKRSGADNVGGQMNAVAQGDFAEAVALATSSPFGVGGARFHYSDKEEYVDTVFMGAWRKDVFQRIGVFDEELCAIRMTNSITVFGHRAAKSCLAIASSLSITTALLSRRFGVNISSTATGK